MDFHAEANSKTKEKFNFLLANKVSVQPLQNTEVPFPK